MWIQTTWIPLAIGSYFWKQEKLTGEYQNDGAFSGLFQNVFKQFHINLQTHGHCCDHHPNDDSENDNNCHQIHPTTKRLHQ